MLVCIMWTCCLEACKAGVGVQITDAMLHPQTPSALVHSVKVPWATFRKTFPLYMSISLVPYVVSEVFLLASASDVLIPLPTCQSSCH